VTSRQAPGWEALAARYLGDVLSALEQSPKAIHAFISAFTGHPDPAGSATRPGTIAAVIVILALILTIAGWIRSVIRRVTKAT